MIRFTVDSPDFAKGLSNALAFIPAVSQIREVYLQVEPREGLMRIVGTDGYAAGMELVPFRDYEGPGLPSHYLISVGKAETKDAPGRGAAHLERIARTSGKLPASVAFTPDGLVFEPMGGGEDAPVELAQSSIRLETYHNLLSLMEETERRPASIPGVLCLDPALLSRFAKVKADKSQGRMADLLFGSDELDRVLVKIGPNFRGLIMPVDREVNGRNVGQDGLW